MQHSVLFPLSQYTCHLYCVPLQLLGSLYRGGVLAAWDNLVSRGITRKSINRTMVIPTSCAADVAGSGVAFQSSFFRP